MAKAATFTLVPESALNSELKAGRLRRAYFLYGEEVYLTGLYADKIAKTAGSDEADGLNFLRLRGVPDMNSLSDFAESMPFFAEHKCVRITDLDPEELDNDQLKALISLIEQLPDTTVLIIAQTGLEVDDRKPKAKTKKLIQAIEQCGAVCKMQFLPLEKTAAMAAKKAARSGCSLSQENALHLAELCGRSLTIIQNEVDKLCAYQQSGEISRADIDALTPRQIDVSVYALADSLLSGKPGTAYRMLDDIFAQCVEPIIIMSALSGAFVDYYRAKLGQQARKTPADAAKDFGYYGRAFVMTNAYRSVQRLSERFLKDCIAVLFRTNKLMNSSKTDSRLLLERAIAEISALPH